MTGKGGVGKTVLSAAIGMVAAKVDRKVLLAEMSKIEEIPPLFGKGNAGYHGEWIGENIFSINLIPRLAFKDFIISQVRFESVYKAIFENKMVNKFLDFAPGLDDLLCLGRLMEFERGTFADQYLVPDLIVFDAPPAGKIQSMLRTPEKVCKMVRKGPAYRNAKNIVELLKNPERTTIFVVAKPEEMAVYESIELVHMAREMLKIDVSMLFMTCYPPLPFPNKDLKTIKRIRRIFSESDTPEGRAVGIMAELALTERERALSARRHKALLEKETGLPVIEIPVIQADEDSALAIAISDMLGKLS